MRVLYRVVRDWAEASDGAGAAAPGSAGVCEGTLVGTELGWPAVLDFLRVEQQPAAHVRAIRYRRTHDEGFRLLSPGDRVAVDDGRVELVLLLSPSYASAASLSGSGLAAASASSAAALAESASSASGGRTLLVASALSSSSGPTNTLRPRSPLSPFHQTSGAGAAGTYLQTQSQSRAGGALAGSSMLAARSPLLAARTADDVASAVRRVSFDAGDMAAQRADDQRRVLSPYATAERRSQMLAPASPGARGASPSASARPQSPSAMTRGTAPPLVDEHGWLALFLAPADLNRFRLVLDQHLLLAGDSFLRMHMERSLPARDVTSEPKQFPPLQRAPLAEHFVQLGGLRAGVAVWERRGAPGMAQTACSVREARYWFPSQVAAFRFLSTLQSIETSPEAGWAAPTGSGCRVFRTPHHVTYLFRVENVVVQLDVSQPDVELKLEMVYEVAQVVESLVRERLPRA